MQSKEKQGELQQNYDARIGSAVVDIKAHFRAKQCLLVKKSSL